MANLVNRRTLLTGFGASGLLARSFPARAQIMDAPDPEASNGESLQGNYYNRSTPIPDRFGGKPWVLSILAPNARSAENIVYRVGDVYSPMARNKISYLMRDIHFNETGLMDPRLFDILSWLQAASASDMPITLTSGFRTPQTEARIFPSNPRMIQTSPHVHGLAADIRIAGVDPAWIRDAALSLGVGGVGWYPRMRFVHVDTGPVRQWVG